MRARQAVPPARWGQDQGLGRIFAGMARFAAQLPATLRPAALPRGLHAGGQHFVFAWRHRPDLLDGARLLRVKGGRCSTMQVWRKDDRARADGSTRLMAPTGLTAFDLRSPHERTALVRLGGAEGCPPASLWSDAGRTAGSRRPPRRPPQPATSRRCRRMMLDASAPCCPMHASEQHGRTTRTALGEDELPAVCTSAAGRALHGQARAPAAACLRRLAPDWPTAGRRAEQAGSAHMGFDRVSRVAECTQLHSRHPVRTQALQTAAAAGLLAVASRLGASGGRAMRPAGASSQL